MISGPVTPRTRAGLWQLLRQRAELLERGLRVAVEQLDLSGGQLGNLDALLRDAGGRPILLALCPEEGDPTLVARILDALAFFDRSGPALRQALPEADLRFEPPYRVMVVGFRLLPDLVEQLEALRLPELHACEIEPFRVGGIERFVVRWRMHPPEAMAETGFHVPSGLIPAAVRTLCGQLLRTLQRLDPELKAEGDRFCRRILHRGQVLCEFVVDGERALVQWPGACPEVLESEPQCRSIGDRILRRYLELDRGAEPAPDSPPAVAPSRALSMEVLKRSVAETRVSREEFSALGESVKEGDVPASD